MFLGSHNQSYLNQWLNSEFISSSFGRISPGDYVFNVSSDFFNPTTIMDIFSSNRGENFIVPQLQQLVDNYTRHHFTSLWSLTQQSSFFMQYHSDLALLNSVFTTNMFNGTALLHMNTNIINEMSFFTKPKTDVVEMTAVLPDHEVTFEIFEVISLNVDNSLYAHLHLPEVKLYYPEPFIASPSFVHEELWFIHILHYQHWLWFFFISLIMLFFITFINVVRWCNPRIRPRRETRGVSRSKCADLITACVPVSWAMTIIISESVDAADYYDGFGTGEIVVGIRAYQWGWEYFFPKNIDLNYTNNPSYSTMTGNSLKYTRTSENTSQSSFFWKSMKSKNINASEATPTHALLSPTDNNKVLDFVNFNSLGSNLITGSNAFKKIQSSSKSNPQDLYNNVTDYSLKYNKINNLYTRDLTTQDSLYYGMKRQHEYSSTASLFNGTSTNLDNKSVSQMLDYNFNYGSKGETSFTTGSLVQSTQNSVAGSLHDVNTSVKEFSTGVSKDNTVLNPTNTVLPSASHVDILPTTISTLNTPQNLLDGNVSYRDMYVKSPNQQVLASDRNVRNIENLNPLKQNYNFTNTQNLLEQASTTFTESHTPTSSVSHTLPTVSYDKFTDNNMNSPIMSAKEELAPNFVFTPFWSTLWANSDINLRLANAESFNNAVVKSSVPAIIEYTEYDFRNWQAIELLEDAFWESTFSSYTQDEYINVLNSANSMFIAQKQENAFNASNRLWATTNKALLKPFFKDHAMRTNLSSLPLYTEDYYGDISLTTLNNFNLPDSEIELDSTDESYSTIKSLNYIYHLNYLNVIGTQLNQVQPLSYTQVLNPFRTGYEENVNSVDSDNEGTFNADYVSNTDNTELRSTNYLKLRSTTKNAIVTFNALQKVFRPRFDEGRSNVRFSDLSNTSVKYPFLTEQRVSYESLLGKNKESFFNVASYKNYLTNSYSTLGSVFNSLNIYFANIPFLLSMQSDASRHMWFDWQSRWTSIEVQPSSVARYSLLGVPYSSKNFEYATQQSDEINDSETYLIRLSKARKNYMSNWALTPYLYNRLSNWYALNGYTSSLTNSLDVNDLRTILKLSSKYWTSPALINPTNNFTPSLSDINTPGRGSWKPTTGNDGYVYTVSTFANLLTKREYLYREYFLNKGYTVNLPKYLTASPSNSLFMEVKSSYNLVDPTSLVSEVSRDLFYNNISNTHFNNLVYMFNTTLNTNNAISNMFMYLFNTDTYGNVGSNHDLYKNQFRPIRKGISNMIRLHATGAIAMPTEIRLHILASSKDIIHSWAIPSAGIKIDCVPGYSSHRVAIFLNSGIFWGQCMEICGRFHHWMPIIVYFMKRDLFFLWCTHFIHFSAGDSTRTAAASELSSNLPKVSLTGAWV